MKDWKQQRSITFRSDVIRSKNVANNINKDLTSFFLEKKYYSQISQNIYNGEFDHGSGLTLAAGLIHASRGAAQIAILGGDRQTGAEHVRNLPKTGE